MTTDREKKLEEALAQFIKPVKGIPFEVIVKALCEFEVIQFSLTHPDCKNNLARIVRAMRAAVQVVQANPIERPRPNEVGNDMEPYVIAALREEGYHASPPKTRAGQGKSTGYPDVLIQTGGIPIYLEVKTHAAENHDTTQRSFYMSPADDPKVTVDAHHLVIGFEIVDRGNNGKQDERGRQLRDYVPVAFTLVDLYGMDCDMKSEFNSDNRRMYASDRILARERIPPQPT